MGTEPEVWKLGGVTPTERISEIQHETLEGDQVSISGFINDPDDSESVLATKYMYNLESGDSSVEHGKIKGRIMESSKYVWEHKKEVSVIAGTVVSVALGSLWVRYKRKK